LTLAANVRDNTATQIRQEAIDCASPLDRHHSRRAPRRATAQAAAKGTTLSQVIRKRLEEFAPDWNAGEDAEDLRAAEEIEARIARGEEELRDWAEVDGELDALPD
jgi:hypothetical protein